MSEQIQQLRTDLEAQRARNAKRRKKLLVLVLLLLLLCIGSIVTLRQLGYIRYPWEQASGMVAGNLQAGTLQHLSSEDLLEQLQKQVDESHVAVQLNTAPVFYSGSAAGNLMIQNSEANLYDMQVNIYLGSDNNGQLLYNSGRIFPGYYIQDDKLEIVLDKGFHEAIAYVSFFDGDTHITTVSADLTLTIQN